MGSQMWEVVGGGDKGGIIVRTGADLKSPLEEDRLSTGAMVKEIELRGERLNFDRQDGTGPASGWVSIRLKDKELMAKRDLVAGASAEAAGDGAEAAAEEEVAPGDLVDEDYTFLAPGGVAPTGKTPWLKMNGKAKPDAKARLVLFSWTGNRGGQGSAHNFLKPASPKWTEALAAFEQYEVNYPGRGARMKEPLVEDAGAFVRTLSAELEKALGGGKPLVFLGFSFGAILAFECARVLQEKGLGPMCVVSASAEGPSWRGRAEIGLARMNDAAFERMLAEKGGTDFILQGPPEMKKMYLPVIKSDTKLEENYRHAGAPLRCPVLAFYGSRVGHDKMKTKIADADAKLWLQATTCKASSKVEALPTDWYIFQEPEGCATLAQRLADFCADKLD